MSDIDHIFLLLGASFAGLSLLLVSVTWLETWVERPRRDSR